MVQGIAEIEGRGFGEASKDVGDFEG